jgi:hypothetical protein
MKLKDIVGAIMVLACATSLIDSYLDTNPVMAQLDFIKGLVFLILLYLVTEE